MLRYFRIAIALCLFGLLSLFFVDFSDELPGGLGWLAKVQLVPAVLAGCIGAITAVIVLTLITGRVYCSTLCPLGVFQDLVAWCSKRLVRKKNYAFSKPKTRTRYALFILFLLALALGEVTIIVSSLEPYSIYGRMMNSLAAPVFEMINNMFAWCFFKAGVPYLYYVDPSRLLPSFMIAFTFFAVIGLLAFRWGRTWCNVVCPVGTFLGFLARLALLKIRFDASRCTQCGLCSLKCKAACLDGENRSIDYSRCVDCFNCLDQCPRNALYYGCRDHSIVPEHEPAISDSDSVQVESGESGPANPSKREFLVTLGTLAVMAVSARGNEPKRESGDVRDLRKTLPVADDKFCEYYDKDLLRRDTAILPPGARNMKDFSRLCTACHLCVAACPSRVLQPAFLEYGIMGMLQPLMRFEKGFCNFDCTLCGEVCPNGAIQPLTETEKHLAQVGRVHFVKDVCVVYTDETNCGACSEHCPTQAVTMVPYKESLTIPEIHPDLCVGCGGCEHICPVRPGRAIFVEGLKTQRQAKPFEESTKKEVKIEDFGF